VRTCSAASRSAAHPEHTRVAGGIGPEGNLSPLIIASTRPGTTTFPPERHDQPDFREEGGGVLPPQIFRDLSVLWPSSKSLYNADKARAWPGLLLKDMDDQEL